MKIALAHFRVGETDGVSLEMDKWAKVLERMGHTVVYISGSKGNVARDTFVIEEMYYQSEQNARLKAAFYRNLGLYTEASLKNEILQVAKRIETKLAEIIKSQGIEVIVPNNIFSLGHDIPTAIGFMGAITKTGVKVVFHHHDFWWESSRPYYFNQTTEWGKTVMDTLFVPKIENDNFRHCVINSLAQKGLREKSGVDSVVVPNVFDFGAPAWRQDEYNSTFRRELGVPEDDILVLQGTRVTNRKAIELAVDVVAMLNSQRFREKLKNSNKQFTLAILGLHEGVNGYEKVLFNYIEKKGVRAIINDKIVDHTRSMKQGHKVYSLWDAYVYADIVTYPSIQEGWGNQLLEGIFARVPMVVFEYDVYKADIGTKGFEVFSLGDSYRIRENGLVYVKEEKLAKVCDEIVNTINDDDRREYTADKNYSLGRQYFSLEKLEQILSEVFTNR